MNDTHQRRPQSSWKSIPVAFGALSGLVAGAAIGAIEGPMGVLVGVLVGASLGATCGRVMAREDARASARHRELDAIIGVTSGNMGARPVKRAGGDGEDPTLEAEPWGADLLTPPPPHVT